MANTGKMQQKMCASCAYATGNEKVDPGWSLPRTATGPGWAAKFWSRCKRQT